MRIVVNSCLSAAFLFRIFCWWLLFAFVLPADNIRGYVFGYFMSVRIFNFEYISKLSVIRYIYDESFDKLCSLAVIADIILKYLLV